MRNQFLALAAVIALCGPAVADTTATPDTTDSGAVSSDENHLDDMVCKKQPPTTGSRIAGKTVCMTNRQWLALWDESKRATGAMQNKSISKGSMGN